MADPRWRGDRTSSLYLAEYEKRAAAGSRTFAKLDSVLLAVAAGDEG